MSAVVDWCNSAGCKRPPAIVHVDLDGASDIFAAHGWPYPYADDSLFESGIRNILDFFERNRIRGTLFTVANSLERSFKLDLVREAARRGHEIASHSLTHRNLLLLSRDEKRREIAESREKLEKLPGVRIAGFRAPGYQIDRECLELLSEYGYEYDSSAFPTDVFARRLGVPVTALTAPARLIDGSPLVELPLPDHRPSPFPFNPTYSLLFGSRYFRIGVNRYRANGAPLALLFHLTDVAEPMPSERLNGFRSRLFTLSVLSSKRKLAKCQSMLDTVRSCYEVTATEELLKAFMKRRTMAV